MEESSAGAHTGHVARKGARIPWRLGFVAAAVALTLGILLPGAGAHANEGGAPERTGGDGFISGRVSDLSNDDLPGVTIQVRRQSDNGLEAETTTDSNGEFGPVSVPPDSYTVEAGKQFYVSSSRNLTVSSDTAETVNFVLERGTGFLDGNVTDEDAMPIEGASIIAVDLGDGSVAAQLNSAGDGSFGAEELRAANYTVTVDHPDYVAFDTQITLGVDETRSVFAVLLDKVIFQNRFEAGD